MEVFLHRSHGQDGRFWMAIDGQVLWDRWGPNYGAHDRRINRVALAALYGGIADGGEHSVYQWVDDIEVWDGFPCADPPCGRGNRAHVARESTRVAGLRGATELQRKADVTVTSE